MLKDDAAKAVDASRNGVAPPVPADGEAAYNPLDPMGIGAASMDVWRSILRDPGALMQAQMQLASGWMSAAAGTAIPAGEEKKPLIEPARGDNRWKHQAWSTNPVLDALKQSYLLSCKAMLDSIESADGVDEETKRRVKFFARQFCDAMSPTNSPFLNPAVVEATIQTGGENLRRGMENVLQDIRENDGRVALVDKSKFRVGENIATTPGQVVFRNQLIELIQYTPTTASVYERPLLIAPPWINKYYILDLQPANSLIKYALDSGFQTFVISWRNPDESCANLSMQDYMELGPLTAARVASAICASQDVNQLGYCIGGTLTAMELAYLARTEEVLVNAVTLFTALIEFSDVGEIRAFINEDSLKYLSSKMRERGFLKGEEMADTFTMLRDVDLIWNPAVNRYLLGQDAPAFDLLYWNSDATRLPRAMHEWYLQNLYVKNDLAKPDKLTALGVPLNLGLIKNDAYVVATMEDHIAPWRSAYLATQLFGGDVEFRLGHSGHIAGIVNPPAKGKGSWWGAPSNPASADEWLGSSTKHDGSWWSDWQAWLQARSGEQKPAPAHLGNSEFPPLVAAPGTYVLEK